MRTPHSPSPTFVQYLLHHLLPFIHTQIRKFWFQAAFVGVLLLALLQKNFSIQVAWNAAKQTATPETSLPSPVSTASQHSKSATPPMNVSLLQPRKKKEVPSSDVPADVLHEPTPGFVSTGLASDQEKLEYVKRYAAIAQKEMKQYGIPASITLAQGLLESNAGKSPLARNANNHFGIKCFSSRCYKGHCKNYSDDSHKDFFRVYPNAWESFRAHSLFLQKPRYASLLKLRKKDYRSWARGLSKAGYATDPGYGDKLISMIERFELHQYD